MNQYQEDYCFSTKKVGWGLQENKKFESRSYTEALRSNTVSVASQGFVCVVHVGVNMISETGKAFVQDI